MEIRPQKPTIKGPTETFTGDVWVDSVIQGEEPSRVRVNLVRFTPGARTAWHSHARGQTLYVTEGVGQVQSRGQEITEIRPGDIVFTPSDEWHWHGATPDHFMAHSPSPKVSAQPEARGRLGSTRHRRRVPRDTLRPDC